MEKKRVAIIGTAGVPARYGGFETLAHNLVENLNDVYDLHVYASTKIYKRKERPKKWKGARIHYLPINANGAASIIYDIVSMIHALFFADYYIVLGVSGGFFIPFIKFFTKKKVIVNIDGLEWRRGKWNPIIQKFLKTSERLAVRYSDADITDNESIKRYTAIHYKTASHLIAYGADHVSPQKLDKEDYAKYPFLKNPYAFKVARIEPENNLEMILNAFSERPSKVIVIVGNWNNSDYGRALRIEFLSHENIHLLDPIYDQVELNKLRSNCFMYVHGHSAGGTNPSLVEAMYLKLPILSFDVSYNRATTKNKAIYFNDSEELIERLDDTSYRTLLKIREEMYHIASFNYVWKYISGRYASIIESFDFGYHKPKLKHKVTGVGYNDLLKMGCAHLDYSRLFFEEGFKTGRDEK